MAGKSGNSLMKKVMTSGGSFSRTANEINHHLNKNGYRPLFTKNFKPKKIAGDQCLPGYIESVDIDNYTVRCPRINTSVSVPKDPSNILYKGLGKKSQVWVDIFSEINEEEKLIYTAKIIDVISY